MDCKWIFNIIYITLWMLSLAVAIATLRQAKERIYVDSYDTVTLTVDTGWWGLVAWILYVVLVVIAPMNF